MVTFLSSKVSVGTTTLAWNEMILASEAGVPFFYAKALFEYLCFVLTKIESRNFPLPRGCCPDDLIPGTPILFPREERTYPKTTRQLPRCSLEVKPVFRRRTNDQKCGAIIKVANHVESSNSIGSIKTGARRACSFLSSSSSFMCGWEYVFHLAQSNR